MNYYVSAFIESNKSFSSFKDMGSSWFFKLCEEEPDNSEESSVRYFSLAISLVGSHFCLLWSWENEQMSGIPWTDAIILMSH